VKYTHLEEVVLAQARELKAQRDQIERLCAERDRIAARVEHQRKEWRRGYQTGWAAASRGKVAA
jgi:hypothetical protein